MPNRISKHQVLTQLCIVKSEGTWLKARGLKDRNPFTQWVAQQVIYVQLQHCVRCRLSGDGTGIPKREG